MHKYEEEKCFNLLDEPWIIVKTESNKTQMWSILDVFKHAHDAKMLAGELPTQDIAIMRLLLAIMHGAFVSEKIENVDDAVNLWRELWDLKQFPYEIVESYLEKYRERFWLFHPTQPFYQSAHIKENMDKYKVGKGKKVSTDEKYKTVARLVGDLFQSDNSPRLFPGRTGIKQTSLEYAEAARWLLHLNGFDDDAAKMPTPKGVGYLGQLGLIYIQGGNLFETLMLNFVLADQRNEIFDDGSQECAYWEKEICEDIERQIAQPRAQKDLLTFQSRRILLKRDNGTVIGYLLTMGDYVEKGESLKNEMMTVLRKEDDGIKPKKHVLERQIWRDLSALLGRMHDNSSAPPGVIHWIQTLREDNVDINRIKLVTTGSCYSLKGAGWQIEDYISDTLAINSALLDKLREVWIEDIVDVLNKTDKAVWELGQLASKIDGAAGDSDDNRKKEDARKARENGYYHLDNLFRKWLISINPDKDELEEKMDEWLGITKMQIIELGDEMLNKCSDTTIIGNRNRNEDKKNEVNALQAFLRFRSNVSKHLMRR